MHKCNWPGMEKPLYTRYHDEEWGVPVHNDQQLFEMLILEGMQAGLSWYTILNKRENFRNALDNFDYKLIAKYDESKIEELMQNTGIIRNRLKLKACVTNAMAFMEIQKEFGTFDKYIWGFIDFKPIINKFKTLDELPAKTELSDIISKDLKKRGFKFIGSTVVYAHMQATGMVNDHLTHCFRYKEIINIDGNNVAIK